MIIINYLFHEKVVSQSFQLKLNMFPRWVDPQFDVVEESPNIPPHPQEAPEQEENSSQGREEAVRLLHEHLPLQVEVQVDQMEVPTKVEVPIKVKEPKNVEKPVKEMEESPDNSILQAPQQIDNSSQQREESVRLLHEHQIQQAEAQVSQEVVEKHLCLQVEVQADQVEELINVEDLVKETDESPDIPIQQAPEQEENSVQGREESTRLLNEHQSHQVETQVSQEAEEDFRDYLE